MFAVSSGVFVTGHHNYNKVEILLHCTDQVLEICAVRLVTCFARISCFITYKKPFSNNKYPIRAHYICLWY